MLVVVHGDSAQRPQALRVFEAWLVLQEVATLHERVVAYFEEGARLLHDSVARRLGQLLIDPVVLVRARCEEPARPPTPLTILFEPVSLRQAALSLQLLVLRGDSELDDSALVRFL